MKKTVYVEEKVVVEKVASEIYVCDRCGKKIENIRKEPLKIGMPHYPGLNQKEKDICNKCEQSFKSWLNDWIEKEDDY